MVVTENQRLFVRNQSDLVLQLLAHVKEHKIITDSHRYTIVSFFFRLV